MCDRTLATGSDFSDGAELKPFFSSSVTLALLALYTGVKDSVVTDMYLSMSLKMAELLSGKIASAIKENTSFAGALGILSEAKSIYACGGVTDYPAACEVAEKMRSVSGERCVAVPLSEITGYSRELLCDSGVVIFATEKERALLCETYASRLQSLGARVVLITTENIEDEMTYFDAVISVNDSLTVFNPLPCVAAGYRLAVMLAQAKQRQQENDGQAAS